MVVDYAKSAATMIALGGDKIFMGYVAELGPVDPQISIPLPNGMIQTIPAIAFIEGLEDIKRKIQSGEPPQTYLPMLAQIRPEIIQICKNAIEDSKEFVKKWLSNYMFKNKQDKILDVIDKLCSGKHYKSHGRVIDFKEAKDVLDLNVELIDNTSDLWNKLWELYCRSIEFLKLTNQAKLFENENVSLSMRIDIKTIK